MRALHSGVDSIYNTFKEILQMILIFILSIVGFSKPSNELTETDINNILHRRNNGNGSGGGGMGTMAKKGENHRLYMGRG